MTMGEFRKKNHRDVNGQLRNIVMFDTVLMIQSIITGFRNQEDCFLSDKLVFGSFIVMLEKRRAQLRNR